MEHWFHGDGAPNAEMVADAKAYGVILPAPDPVGLVIWPENVETVEMFMDVQTQWRVGGAGVIGLDYAVVMGLANMKAVADPLGLLRDLQVMEIRARELINAEAAEK